MAQLRTIPIHAVPGPMLSPSRAMSPLASPAPQGTGPDGAAACGTAAGCGACLPGGAVPLCRASLGQPCEAARLVGPTDEVGRLLAALARPLGFAPGLPEQAGVRALIVQPGEVELQLAWPPQGAGAALADAAFQTLRRLLPDTDIYVTHRPGASR